MAVDVTAFRGPGVPRVVKTFDLTAQGADIPVNTLQFVCPQSGMYRVDIYGVITVADAVSSTFPNFRFNVTDAETLVNSNFTVSGTSGANAVGFPNIGAIAAGYPSCFLQNAGQVISPFTQGYVSNTPGQMKFSFHVRIEFLG